MRAPRVTPATYRRITAGAVVALAVIILTGAAVRLTGSGLGCPDWPQCDQERYVAPLELHPMVEYVNRLITGLVSVAVIGAVLGSWWRVPRRRDLLWLSWGLVAGVIGQIVLGGITVLFDLAPPLVMGHFILSLVILADALVLHRRAADSAPPRPSTLDEGVGRLVRAVAVLATVVVVTGTVVTATGPHGGDEDAPRFDFELASVTRVHGTAVVLLLVVTLALVRVAGRRDVERVRKRAAGLALVLFVQGGIGYVQYFTDVPAGLVAAHVAGAVATWTAMVLLVLELADRGADAGGGSPGGGPPATAEPVRAAAPGPPVAGAPAP